MIYGKHNARHEWASALKRNIKCGSAFHVEIRHDNDCAIYGHTRRCSCDPDRVLRDATGNMLATVSGAGSYNLAEFVGDEG